MANNGLHMHANGYQLSQDRALLAVNAGLELSQISTLLKNIAKDDDYPDMSLAIRGLASRINALSTGICSALSDDQETTESIAQRING